MMEKRRKVWVDRFQTYLSIRIALYFVFYQFTVWFLVIVGALSYESLEATLGREAATAWFVLAGGVVLALGIGFIIDAVRYSHRIVGPITRFRKAIKAVTAGEEMDLMDLRKGDLLLPLKDDFNEMLKALEQRGAVVLKPRANVLLQAASTNGATAGQRHDPVPMA